MRSDDLSKALSPESFRPFKLNRSSGESYRITHAQQVLVNGSAGVIGTEQVNGHRRYERLATCALLHFVDLILIGGTKVRWVSRGH